MNIGEKVALHRQFLSDDQTMAELVRMATLAANGHNTQPWAFRLDGQKICILPDFTSRTPVVDPDDHHLWISFGCATENLVIARAALARACAVTVGNRTCRTPVHLGASLIRTNKLGIPLLKIFEEQRPGVVERAFRAVMVYISPWSSSTS